MSMRSNARRGAALIAFAAIACLVMAQGAAAVPPPEATQTQKPRINMERLLLAAQLDQYRPNNGKTRGAVRSVRRVQKQLRRRGFNVAVDGNFGAQTVNGYAAWQRRLGYSGLDASGMPGETSLKRLAGRRFVVTRVVRPGARRAWSGVTLNVRTIRMLRAAGRLVGGRSCVLDATKGSYTGPDSSSAATHAGGGAVDLSIRTRCGKTVRRVVRSLRRVGFAAWFRNWSGNEHIHAIAISDPDMATENAFPGNFDAREQVVAFAQKKDGLSGASTGPMPRRLRTWEQFKRSR
jgi:peptidoglycan hydrolase-like protein with peptidoglycan-binding domain